MSSPVENDLQLEAIGLKKLETVSTAIANHLQLGTAGLG
jgi:hypothetical protein